MWHTSAGDRTLEGAEALLIREAMGWVLDMLEPETDDDFWLFGIPAFDRLELGQKLALVCQVGQALLRPDTPPPNLTALNESTVGVLYRGIRQCIRIEIGDATDGFEARHWRRLVIAAVTEVQRVDPAVGQPEPLPEQDCPDMEEWELMVETLEGQVLWDADWLDEDLFLDADPDTTATMRQELGIADDYYTAIAPDPSERELVAIRGRLRELVGG